MNKYISHYSAAFAWDVPNIDTVLDIARESERKDAEREKLSNDICTNHLTVTDAKSRYRKNGCTIHSSVMSLPEGSIVKRGGQMVATPQLLYLELANELEFHRLVLLGLQLCSHRQGRPSTALVSKETLASFISAAAGHCGRQKARCALAYIENGSASIMESIAFMMLSLPHMYGGFALKGACFNREISLDEEAKKRLKQSRCFVDMYYPDEKIAVEYDSFAHHSTPAEQAKDLVRASVLERQGISVVRLSTVQLYDDMAFAEFAHNLAARLGKRIRIRTSSFKAGRKALRSLLPKARTDLS